MDENTHDKLVQAYLSYFKTNEQFEQTPSVRKYYAVQKEIKKIRNLAETRRKEISSHYKACKKDRRIKNKNRP